MRVLLAQINSTIGDFEGNAEKIIQGIQEARKSNADIVVFPEMCLSGYIPDDFLLLPHFITECNARLNEIIKYTYGVIAMIGLPRINPDSGEKSLYNSAAIIQNGALLGFQDKVLLPTYDVFDERRYFEPASIIKVWNLNGQRIAITICEDIWKLSVPHTSYFRDPLVELEPYHPDLLINLSASPFCVDRTQTRLHVCQRAAQMLQCPVLLCNQVGGNDSLIFDGTSLAVDSDGTLFAYAKSFESDNLLIDLSLSKESCELKSDEPADLYHALVLGLRDYFTKSGFKKACLGISGGIDSALVACIAAKALGSENVLGVAMPSRYSSRESLDDARHLARHLGILYSEISIEKPFQSYLDLLTPYFEEKAPDTTEENLQARIRGMILMAFSNKHGYIVLSTGNKSELAMGYATLYGDMCGGLGVINDVTKMQVYKICRWINRYKEIIPYSTIEKEPSAELKPNQKDSDTLPSYTIIDNVLQAYVEEHKSPEEIAKMFQYPLNLVKDLIGRIHRNEYKRRQSPPGLRVSQKAFSVGRRFPIVQKFEI